MHTAVIAGSWHLRCTPDPQPMKTCETITDQLAGVSGGGPYVFKLPASSAKPVVGQNVSPQQRAQNDALKQRLKDERWIRHKDIPDWAWAKDSLGFWHPE